MRFHQRPTPAAASVPRFPTPRRRTLDNGLAVLTCDRPGQRLITETCSQGRGMVTAELVLPAPLHTEPAGLDGVGVITARALREGAGDLDAEAFTAELERCGASMSVTAKHQGFRLTVDVPAGNLRRALELLTLAVARPRFDGAEIERLRDNCVDEVGQLLAQPRYRASLALHAALFAPGDRVSRPRLGSVETLRAIEPEHVLAFYRAHVRPDGATLVLSGDLSNGGISNGEISTGGISIGDISNDELSSSDMSSSDVASMVADTLGSWRAPSTPRSPLPTVTVDDRTRVVVVDRPGSVQTHVMIGRLGADRRGERWPAHRVANHCLGGTLTSRLDRVLREEKGYTYGMRASAAMLYPMPGGDGVLNMISGSVAADVTAPALADIWSVLSEVATTGLTDEERDLAVRFLVDSTGLRMETSSAVAAMIADQVEQELPDDYSATLPYRIAEVSTADATAAISELFGTDRLVVVLVGDANSFVDDVCACDIGEVSIIR